MFYKCFVNFVIGTKEKLQKAPQFKTDFVMLNIILLGAHPLLLAFRLTC